MGEEVQIAFDLPRWRTVESDVEAIVLEFYGADEASASVVDEGPEQFTLEVEYDGDLARDPRAFTEEGDEKVVLASITEHVSESKAQIIYRRTTREAARTDLSAVLPIDVLVRRHDLHSTDHDRVWTRHEDDDPKLVEAGKTVAEEVDAVRVLVSESDRQDDGVSWGYMKAFNLLTLRCEPSPSEIRTERVVAEFREQFR